MFRLKPFFVTSLLVVTAVVALAACGGETSTPTPVPPTATSIAVEQPTVGQAQGAASPISGSVADILTRAATAMTDVKSYHGTFTTQMTNNTVNSVFDFQAPDRLHFNYNLPSGNVDIIIVGKDAYGKAPGANGYTSIPLGGYNVGAVSPAQVDILLNEAQNSQVVGDEQVQGLNATHIKFTYDTNKVFGEMAQQVGQATPTPIPDLGATTMDAWVDKSTGYIVQYKTSVTGGGVGAVTSTVVLSKFNEPVNPPIVPPTVSP